MAWRDRLGGLAFDQTHDGLLVTLPRSSTLLRR